MYRRAATNKATQTETTATKYGCSARSIVLIVASAFSLLGAAALTAAGPPDHLLRKIAQRETDAAQARANYTFRQSVSIEEFDNHGRQGGQYRETRDVMFSPEKGRYETLLASPRDSLQHIRLTEQDFNDIRNIQPFNLTLEDASYYSMKYRGEETVDTFPCFVVALEPKQILASQRFFQGLLWVKESDFTVVRSEGQAVPAIETMKEQNLFPRFTTVRREIDGKWFFPVETKADDTLYFRTGPQRMRVVIRYAEYHRFGSDSVIHYQPPDPK